MPPVRKSSSAAVSAAASDDATWYALFSKPRMEALALATLTALGYSAWLPLCLLERRHARRTETVRAPLFPRYLFLALVDGRDGLGPALDVSGVAGVVRTRSGEPLRVRSGDLTRLRGRIGEAGGAIDLRPRTALDHYALGDRLTVPVGPFGAELPVVIEAAADGRMTMALDIMGRKVAIPARYAERLR